MAISGTKGQGWRAIPTQYRKASDILTSTLAAFLFSSHPKRERDREAHLNYYTSAINRERQLHTTRQQEGLTVASIAQDDPSTLPGDDPFPRARIHRDHAR